MATMNVSTPDQMKAWVEAQISSGNYANASDYVRDLIRHGQDYHQKLGKLRVTIDEGRKSSVSDRTIDDICLISRHVMPMRIELSQEAEQDIDDILDDTLTTFGKAQADEFLDA